MTEHLYDRWGHVYRKVSDLPDGKVLVNQQQSFVYEDADEPEFEDWKLVIMAPERLGEKPPKTALAGEIQKLHEQRSEAIQELSDLQQQISDAKSALKLVQSDHNEVLKRLSAYPPLAKLEAYMRGEIRYVVWRNYGPPTVFDLTDEKAVERLKDRDDYHRGLHLISLKGSIGRGTSDVRWTINNDLAGLAVDEDELPEILLQFISKCIDDNRPQGLLALVEKWNVPITKHQREVIQTYEDRVAQRKREDRLKERDNLKDRLEKLEAEINA